MKPRTRPTGSSNGKFALKLRLRPNAKKGLAKLTVRIGGAKPLVRAIKVTKHD